MTEINRIIDMLKRTFYKEAWHGLALMEILNGVTAEQALKKPISNTHSIWEMVLHAQTWIDAVRIRTSGKEYKVTDEQDWPEVTDNSEAAWKKTIDDLKKAHKKLEEHAESFETSDLSKKAGGSTLTNYILLHSIIHHNTYHAAQVALLKKLV